MVTNGQLVLPYLQRTPHEHVRLSVGVPRDEIRGVRGERDESAVRRDRLLATAAVGLSGGADRRIASSSARATSTVTGASSSARSASYG